MPRKLTDEQARRIRHRRAAGETCDSLAEDFDITSQAISKLCRGDTYRTVGGPRTRTDEEPPTSRCIDCTQETSAPQMIGTEHGLVCPDCSTSS